MVSVIVPNYNYEQYLTSRIDTILNQTYRDFELILLDDCSTDNSREILESYRDNPHVSHIVFNEKNTGSPFRQWMKGIELARGKYVWIAEADDLAKPEFLEKCVAQLERYDDVSVCYAGSLIIDAEGNVSNRDVNHWGRRKAKKVLCYNGMEYVRHNLYWKNYIINASGAVFCREKALELKKSPFLEMRYCGDWLFWVEMAMKGNVVEVYENLNYFRHHQAKVTTASRKAGDGVAEDIRVVKFMEPYLHGLSRYEKRLRRGLLYRKIRRLALDDETKARLYSCLYKELNSSKADYLKIERVNKYLKLVNPWLVTPKRDRL